MLRTESLQINIEHRSKRRSGGNLDYMQHISRAGFCLLPAFQPEKQRGFQRSTWSWGVGKAVEASSRGQGPFMDFFKKIMSFY